MEIQVNRESLEGEYRELLFRNPALAKAKGQMESQGWSEAEIRTALLILAVHSNASIQSRLHEIEASLGAQMPRAG